MSGNQELANWIYRTIQQHNRAKTSSLRSAYEQLLHKYFSREILESKEGGLVNAQKKLWSVLQDNVALLTQYLSSACQDQDQNVSIGYYTLPDGKTIRLTDQSISQYFWQDQIFRDPEKR